MSKRDLVNYGRLLQIEGAIKAGKADIRRATMFITGAKALKAATFELTEKDLPLVHVLEVKMRSPDDVRSFAAYLIDAADAMDELIALADSGEDAGVEEDEPVDIPF